MLKFITEIDGQETQPAVNAEDVEIELNFDDNDPDAKGVVTVNGWRFSALEAEIINQYKLAGLTGGPGITEGLSYGLFIEDNNGRSQILNSYLDLATEETVFECSEVQAPSRLRGGNDWLTEAANITYDVIFKQGIITTADWVQVPYINSSIPDRNAIAIAALSGFVITAQLRTIIKDLLAFIAEVGGVFTTIPAVINLAAYIIFLVIIIAALIRVIIELVSAIIQPVKYHAGMKLITLLEKGAEALGMTFSSGIFEEDPFWKTAVVIPPKFQSFEDPRNPLGLGLTTPAPTAQKGYFDGSYKELLDRCKALFNAKIISRDGVIKLERVRANTSVENYTLPDVEQRISRTNASELIANLSIEFRTDDQDENTMDNYLGTVTKIATRPRTVVNPDSLLMKGEARIDTGFAKGVRKDTLTKPEQFFDVIIKAACPLLSETLGRAHLNALPGINLNNICNIIPNRLGMLKISSDFFSEHKLVGLDINNASPASTDLTTEGLLKINSLALWLFYYKPSSFVPSTAYPNANQWERYTTEVPFCKEEFELVENNNLIFDTQGRVAKVESLKWSVLKQRATINYRVNELWTNNLIEIVTTPDGH